MDEPTARWNFPIVHKMRVQGRATVEDNFAPEKRTREDIFMREAVQNPADARLAGSSGPVEVRFRLLKGAEIDGAYLNELIDDDFIERLNESTPGKAKFQRPTEPSVLVIEDFGTIGLEGVVDDANCDGQGQNWNAFWFREGEGAKVAGSNGRAGQGKITYYRMSNVRAIFGFTVQASSGKALLMGRSSFRRTYEHASEKYERDSFWCKEQDESAFPVIQPDRLARFRAAFGLQRTTESGLSIVIPYPSGFSESDAIRVLVTDFYHAIARDKLSVTIGDTKICSTTVAQLADQYLSDKEANERDSSFTKGYRDFIKGIIEDGPPKAVLTGDWARATVLKEDAFEVDIVNQLRKNLDDGLRVSVRFPVTVRPVGKPTIATYFDVYLQMPENLARPEEAYIRKDLLIGHESYLTKATYLPPARGLTLIDHADLSAFLADAEEPTHMKWNASRPRLSEDYERPKEVVALVRQAMPRLLALLSNSLTIRDTKSLANFFPQPKTDAVSKTPGGPTGAAEKGATSDSIPPLTAKGKPFRWEHGETWDKVTAKNLGEPGFPELPLRAIVEMAYQGLDDDAFDAYDPFDFNLTNVTAHPVKEVGCSVLDRQGNKIKIEITASDFSLEVGGFDPNLFRRMRIDYKAESNGTDIIDE